MNNNAKQLIIEKDFYKMPKEYAEKKAKTQLNGTENAILTIIELATFSYQKDRHEISHSYFEKAINKNHSIINKALKSLKKRKIIKIYGLSNKRSNIIGINFNYKEWDKPKIDIIPGAIFQPQKIKEEQTKNIDNVEEFEKLFDNSG